MSERIFKIFMDFDGTISQQDVGELIFRTFADEDKVNKIIDDLLNDRISSRDCWIKLCNVVPEINKTELDDFIDKLPLDETFINFINYCTDEQNHIYVLSDGFDYYINKIFKKNGIEGLTVYSNHLEIVDRKMIPRFPYYDDSSFSSANCKRNHIIHHSSDSDFTVFIGDGNSDKDSVEYCDFIFAKGDLLRHCEMERITFYPFDNFDDVVKKLTKLKSKKKLKKRNSAELKRNQAYMAE